MNEETRAAEAEKWAKAMGTHSALTIANLPSDPNAAKTQLLCVIRMAGNAYGALCGQKVPHPVREDRTGEGTELSINYDSRVGDELEGLAITLGNGGVLP